MRTHISLSSSHLLAPSYVDHKNPDPFPCATLLPCRENLIGAASARLPAAAGACSSASSFTRNKMDGGTGTIEGLIFRGHTPCSEALKSEGSE